MSNYQVKFDIFITINCGFCWRNTSTSTLGSYWIGFSTRLQRFGDLLMFDFNPDLDWKRLFYICFYALVMLSTLPLILLIGLMIKLKAVFLTHCYVCYFVVSCILW